MSIINTDEILEETSFVMSEKMHLSSKEIELFKCSIKHLIESGFADEAEKIIKDAKAGKKGSVLEALVYEYFKCVGISFCPQVRVDKENTFKKPKKADDECYMADGKIYQLEDNEYEETHCSVYFDIKSLGAGEAMLEEFKKKLAYEFKGYYINIAGDMSISIESVEENVLKRKKAIIEELNEMVKMDELQIQYTIANTHVIIQMMKIVGVHVGELSLFDPYKWALEHQGLPYNHCSQFIKNRPFVLIFAYDQTEKLMYATDFANSNSTCFRSLARRAFLNKDLHTSKLVSYDGKAVDGKTIAEVVNYLSAIIFLRVDSEFNLTFKDNSCHVFINPNAINKVPNYMIECLSTAKADIETFVFDNY